MGQAIGQILPLAVVVAISPFPIIAVVLLLVTPRGRTNGPAFVVGFVAGLSLVGAIVLLLAPDATEGGGTPATWVSTLKLALGLLLIVLAYTNWRGRPRGADEPAMPKWMAAIDSFTAPKAAGAGVVLSAVNPKTLVFAVAAAVAVAQSSISTGEEVLAYAVFVLIGTLGVAVPVVMYFTMGERAAAPLDQLKGWMARNNAVIMAVILLVIGVKLVGDAISGLSA